MFEHVNVVDVPVTPSWTCSHVGELAWACWPADAGRDYASIIQDGFNSRVLHRDGVPELVQA